MAGEHGHGGTLAGKLPGRAAFGRRPGIAALAAAWTGGAALALAGHGLAPAWVLAAPAFAMAVTALRFPRAWLLAAALLGAAWTTQAARAELDARLPQRLEGHTLMVRGRVAGLVRHESGRVRFHLAVGRIREPDGRAVPGVRRIALSWYHPHRATPRVGERWRFAVRLERPRSLADPGAFDYARWAFAHGIAAGGYVYHGGAQRLGGASPGLGTVRARIVRAIHAALPHSPWAGLVAGLAVGARGGVSAAQWHTLRATGTSHLLAISGLHLGLVAALAFFLFASLARRIPPLADRIPARLAGGAGAAGAALAYAALAGFSLPTQRALVMLALPLLALALRRRVRVGTALGAAAMIVTLITPLAVVTASFWMSFGAVAALTWGLCAARPGRGVVRAQFVVSLGLVPLVGLFFGRVSLVGPAANFFAIPVVGWLAVPPALAGAGLSLLHPGWGAAGFAASAAVLAHVWPALQWLAGRDLATIGAAPADWFALAAAAGGAACLLAPRGLGLRLAGLALLVPLFRPAAPVPRHGNFRVTVLDVGQGLAAAVRTAHHLLLVDTGPKWWGGNDAGRSIVIPFLRARHLGRPEMVVLSHADSDHSGGLHSLHRRWPELPVLSGARGASHPCRRGQHWRWDGVAFAVLGPAPGQAGSRNNRSCVLRVSGPGGAVLFPGDIEHPGEQALLDAVPGRLRAAVLVAPHHGSDTSSGPAFVRAVAPRFVVFAVGYRNRYGFPRPEVVARYRGEGARRLSSAHAGAVTFDVTRDGGVVLSGRYRPAHRRPWTDP